MPTPSGEPQSTRLSGTAKTPVDVQHLRRYTLGDRKLEAEILQLFLLQLPQLTAALRSAATERDWHMATHSLKGAGRAVGAWRVADLAEAAERLPFSSGYEARETAILSLEEAAGEARGFIDTLDCSR
jgi:HPt (histidine-containing phosphotransfer) domain-containing protein